ncbi:hypothetical protein LL971_20430 [Xanthomonas campestris pv. parthenii]|nr:hypothetical protein [Xanthomonas campestris pv. parthenii]
MRAGLATVSMGATQQRTPSDARNVDVVEAAVTVEKRREVAGGPRVRGAFFVSGVQSSKAGAIEPVQGDSTASVVWLHACGLDLLRQSGVMDVCQRVSCVFTNAAHPGE